MSDASKVAIIAWNVMHMDREITHGLNTSPIIALYNIHQNRSNEKARLNDIKAKLEKILNGLLASECFVCLQEVPGDLLPILDEMLRSLPGSSNPVMHTQAYEKTPEVPESLGKSPYTNSSESLVTIHCGKHTGGDKISWIPCATNKGKGALVLKTASGLRIVNAHIPYNEQHATVLLRDIPGPESGERGVVLAGDMNCTPDIIEKRMDAAKKDNPSLGDLYPIGTKKATRFGIKPGGIREEFWIDYFIVSTSLKDSFTSDSVIVHDDVRDMSDHYPISVEFKY